LLVGGGGDERGGAVDIVRRGVPAKAEPDAGTSLGVSKAERAEHMARAA